MLTIQKSIFRLKALWYKDYRRAYGKIVHLDKKPHEAIARNIEVAELYEQIGRLKVENDFLKKKCEVFRG